MRRCVDCWSWFVPVRDDDVRCPAHTPPPAEPLPSKSIFRRLVERED
jgi:hypothetical protein